MLFLKNIDEHIFRFVSILAREYLINHIKILLNKK
jgi:hypothetical protein